MNIKKLSKEQQVIVGAFTIVVLAFVIKAWSDHKNVKTLSSNIDTLSAHIVNLETSLASTTAELQKNIVATDVKFSEALNIEKQNSAALQQRLGNFQTQVGTLSGTLNTLEKLSKTDPELLQKYSKVFFLNEHYSPPRLTEIQSEYKYSDTKILKIHSSVWPNLKSLIDDAGKNDVKIYVSSAFRSFNEQSALKGQYTVSYGAGTANQFSADQGYSEHQLGTTVDFITTGLGGALDGFDSTKAYTWLVANAHRYGFTLSYPKDNKFYVFEPWHWRYVGVKLATDLHNKGKHFYDLDQREIDEYLVSVFE